MLGHSLPVVLSSSSFTTVTPTTDSQERENKAKQRWFVIFLFPAQLTTWPHKLLNCRTGGRSDQLGEKPFKQPLQLLPTESGAAASQETQDSA